MKYLITTLILVGFIVLSGCGEKMKEMQQTMDVLKKAPEAVQNMANDTKAAEQKRKDRVKSGDTLAMPYQELQKYLPESIGGYTAQEPKGSTTNMTGFSVTEVSRRFVKPGANGSENFVDVEMTDYNQAEQMYAGLTAIWALGISVESNEKSEKSYKPDYPNSLGFESYDKIHKNATLNIGLGWRFFVKIEANNQSSCDFIKGIANSMKLKDLSTK
ncbi:MAG: hypothetical protein ABSG15_01270 [FCB group bacterium]